jgi:hypothetical protein
MKQLMRKLKIFGMAMCVVLPASWAGEFDYASYTQTTLQDIMIVEEQNHSHDRVEANKYADCIQLECQVSKFRVLCGYSPVRRPISDKKKNAITLWTETLKIDPKLASLYRQEMLVTEGTRDHWIPIQEQLLSYIDDEFVKNDTIELFIILVGKVESEYVFIATEFEKPISPAKNPIQVTVNPRAASYRFVRYSDPSVKSRRKNPDHVANVIRH